MHVCVSFFERHMACMNLRACPHNVLYFHKCYQPRVSEVFQNDLQPGYHYVLYKCSVRYGPGCRTLVYKYLHCTLVISPAVIIDWGGQRLHRDVL